MVNMGDYAIIPDFIYLRHKLLYLDASRFALIIDPDFPEGPPVL